MRLALALCGMAVLAACHWAEFDPTDDLTYREFADTQTAVRTILDEVGPVRVYAVGEYHPTRTLAGASPMSRFTRDILALLAPRSRHLVVETWLDDTCDAASREVRREITDATGRPPSTRKDMDAMIMKSWRSKLVAHGLSMSCIEHGALLGPTGRVDFLRLLELVTDKLGQTTRALVGDPKEDKAVIVYGGALHNDLYPRWPLADLSYAKPLSAELGGGVMEIDLVVPEVVAPMPMVRLEDWFPLLSRAAPGRTIVWERGPLSYVVILPAQDLAAAEVAKPRRVAALE